MTKIIQSIPMCLLVTFAGFITFMNQNICITSDMNEYMNYALNIFLARGYTTIEGTLVLIRGPLFPLMIAGFYWLLGVSLSSAFWVVRIFSILNPVIVYFLTKKFYGKWTGCFASFLILTSYSMNYWSYRHIDSVWPFFSLCFILTIYLSFERKLFKYFIFSGVLISIAYLVKPVALLLFPLPFLLFFINKDYRDNKNLPSLIVYIATIGIIITPWILYVYYHTEDLRYSFLGIGGVAAVEDTLKHKIYFLINNYFIGIINYYKGYSQSISNNFFIAPLFISSWLFVFLKAIVKDKISILMVCIFLLLSPFISFVGRNNFRIGQSLLFIMLSYIIIAHFVVSIGNFIFLRFSRLFSKKNNIQINTIRFGNSLLLMCLLGFQLFINYGNDRGGYEFLKKSIFLSSDNIACKNKSFSINNEWNEVASWVMKNINSNSYIMCSWYNDSQMLYFYTRGRYQVTTMPYTTVEWGAYKGKGSKNTFSLFSMDDIKLPAASDLLFFSSQAGSDDPRWSRCWFLYESIFLSNLVDKKIDYFIIGPVLNFLSLYCREHNAFEEVSSFYNGKIKIFRVKTSLIKDIDNKRFITERTLRFLNNRRSKNPQVLKMITNNLMRDKMGLTGEFINELISGELDNNFYRVKINEIY